MWMRPLARSTSRQSRWQSSCARGPAKVRLLALVAAVAVDRLDVDLAQRPVGEVGEQVAQGPLEVFVAAWAHLRPARSEPVPGEWAEERRGLRPVAGMAAARAVAIGWDPEASADVGEDVLELLLGALARPAVAL
jgi:hypothetical protein